MGDVSYSPNGIIAVFLAFGCILLLFLLLVSGEIAAMHNQEMAALVFSDEELPEELEEHDRIQIIMMRRAMLSIESIYDLDDCESKPNLFRVQAFFYVLFFGDSNPNVSTEDFYQCFRNETGAETSVIQIYANIETLLQRSVTETELIRAAELYYYLKYEMYDWTETFPGDLGGDGTSVEKRCVSPIVKDWSAVVSSEFGLRKDPISDELLKHGGIDFAIPSGSAVLCAWDGTIQAVRYDENGYGYHVIVNHGNGVISMYAHCSRLLVRERQTVSGGDVIAVSGNTGKSTGPHLHFEIRMNGVQVNPRLYLP